MAASQGRDGNGAAADDDNDGEAFHEFFERWLVEQNQHLQELVSASRDSDATAAREKIGCVIAHYEQYYGAKSRWVKIHAFSMFNPSWLSSLEDAFMWAAGWRPTMAFQLLYSKSGLQFKARFDELIQGLTTGDLGELSSTQLRQVDELHRAVIREEKEITERLAKRQETVADSAMVELSHAASESTQAVDAASVEVALGEKEEGLAEVLQMADELRLKTLKQVVEILTPMQGVHFLIAAAELHLRLHEWGKKRDSGHRDQGVKVISESHKA